MLGLDGAPTDVDGVFTEGRGGGEDLWGYVMTVLHALLLEETVAILCRDASELFDANATEFGKRAAGSRLTYDVVVDVACARHGADDQCATGLDKGLDIGGPFLVPHDPMGM